MTNFEKLTASLETLGAFLASIPTTGGPWDEAFRREFCAGCGQEDCEPTCPHQDNLRLTGSDICRNFRLLIIALLFLIVCQAERSA